MVVPTGDGMMSVLQVSIPHKGKKPPRKTYMSLEAESRLAAKDMGYTWAEFEALAGDDLWANGGDSKCKVLMMYRINNKLEELSWQS